MAADDDALIDVETVVAMMVEAPVLEGDDLRFVLDALASATDSALDFLSGPTCYQPIRQKEKRK